MCTAQTLLTQHFSWLACSDLMLLLPFFADLLSGAGLGIEGGADESDFGNDPGESADADSIEEHNDLSDDLASDEDNDAVDLDDTKVSLRRQAAVKSLPSQSKDLLPTEDK